ncbi:MAG: rod shape-determining protein MreC [Armatimonadetes bacterium]|nr:rod shape-determining protein MreC [Armatimonadota bacterium]
MALKQPSPVTRPVMAALAPGQRWMTDARTGFEAILRKAAGPPRPNDEARRLKAELERYKAATQNLKRKNEELSNLLQLKEQVPYTSVVARIIGEGDKSWAQTATIDRGTRDGIRPRHVVVTKDGVAGQVTGVIGPNSATVLYLTDPSSSVGVRVLRNRIPGVARGEGSDTLSLTYLDKTADVRVGDAIVTSGWGGIYPPGLFIGKVSSVRTNVSGTGRTATIEPAVDFHRLEEALVLRKD